MLPNRCAMVKNGRQCPNPPTYTISIRVQADEYMVGVTCDAHKQAASDRIARLQKSGGMPNGVIGFSPLRPVGTDCVRTDPDDLISI